MCNDERRKSDCGKKEGVKENEGMLRVSERARKLKGEDHVCGKERRLKQTKDSRRD